MSLENPPPIDEKPPLFGKWSTWYGIVVVNLIVMAMLFYLFSKIYA
jgi:hypothetical protein